MNFHLAFAFAQSNYVHAATHQSSPPTQHTSAAKRPVSPFVPREAELATSSSSRASESMRADQMSLPTFVCASLCVPGESAVSPEIAEKRRRVESVVNSCFQAELAPGTLKTYQSSLQRIVPLAEEQLGMKLLPLSSEDNFVGLFGFLRLHKDHQLQWSQVKLLKAAVSKWHDRMRLPSVFQQWTPSMRAFWAGLSKAASHTVKGKDPVSFTDLCAYLKSVENRLDELLCLRNACMIAVAFFGVRRGAEVVQFILGDVCRRVLGSSCTSNM